MIEFLSEYFRYNTHGLLNLAAAMFDILVGVIVLLQNPKSKINKAFFLLTLSTCIWLGSFGMLSVVRNSADSYIWMQTSYVLGVSFIPSFFYLFSVVIRNRPLNQTYFRLMILWSILAMIPITFFTPYVLELAEYSWGRYPTFTLTPFSTFHAVFILVPFCFLALLTFLNFNEARKIAVSPNERIQARNIYIGCLIAYIGIFDFVVTFRIPYYPTGFIWLTIFLSIVAYNIIRHQFFEIDVALKKFSIIFLIYAFLLALALPIAIHIINENFNSISHRQTTSIIELAFLIGVVCSIGPLIYASIVRHSFWLRQHSATGLTHELKSPLATIQSATQMLLDEQTGDNPDKIKTYEYLHMVQRNTERLELFVKDLLSIAKIQNEDVSLRKTSIDLNKTISEVAETYAVLANKNGVSFKLDLSQTKPIEADQQKIQQVISNLISNALKFSDGGFINIATHQNEKSIHCTVTDTGKGIPIKDLDRVFDRFYHGNHSNKGAGLGLTIAKAWVEAHGGKIWAESEGEGKGTRVTFTLPL